MTNFIVTIMYIYFLVMIGLALKMYFTYKKVGKKNKKVNELKSVI